MFVGGYVRGVCIALAGFLLATALVVADAATPNRAWAQSDQQVRTGLERAAVLYDQSKFEEAIQAAKQVVSNRNSSAADVQRAREWIARSQVKLGHRVEAKAMFKTMLGEDAQYRPDPLRIPPDEIEVFNSALEEALPGEAGWPGGPSIGAFVGYGLYSNSEINDSLTSETYFVQGIDEIKHGVEFGGSIRFPVLSKLSVQLEVDRLHASQKDTSDVYEFQISGVPLVASAYYTLVSKPKTRLSVFLGAGPMLSTSYDLSFLFYQLSGQKSGFYMHGGLEGEYLLARRYSVSLRALGRSAKAKNVEDDTLPDYNYDVDFNGIAVQLGVRVYVGR